MGTEGVIVKGFACVFVGCDRLLQGCYRFPRIGETGSTFEGFRKARLRLTSLLCCCASSAVASLTFG